MLEFLSVPSIFIQPLIEEEKWLYSFHELIALYVKLITKIYKFSILIEESKFNAIYRKSLDREITRMLLKKIKEFLINIRHICPF